MTRRRLGTRPGSIVTCGLATAVAALAGIAPHTSAPASALTPATDPETCVSPLPADQLVPDQAVTGLTVTRGTEPEPFGGTYLDTLVDGIAPGVDLIVAELDSPAIAANGIWQGMSGSPVYDPVTGQLIGAVSYALSMGPTTIAGITPAEEMLDLLAGPESQPEPLPEQVVVTPSLRASLMDSGDATRAQASAGLRRLPVPLAVSGLTQRRFDQLNGLFGNGAQVTRAAGGTSSAAEEIAIHPGGNLAASLSHGAVTTAAIGTATAVCGDQVIGFGHPLAYAGDTTYSLHGARAVTIQPDPIMSAYKLANLGAPVGTVTEDRLAGLAGIIGASPATFEVSSTATYRGRNAQGTTQVSVAEWLSDIGLATMASVNDRALDHAGQGSAVASWTIEGLRRNGNPFTVTSGDLYADSYDIASAPLMDLAHQLYSLTENNTERVTITSVTTTTDFRDDASRWRLGKTYAKVGGQWRPTTARRPLVVKAGSSRRVRVELVSRDHDSRFVNVEVTVPARAANKVGRLVLAGGAGSEDDFFFFEDEGMFLFEVYGGRGPTTIPELIKSFGTEQKNDEIRSTLRVRGTRTTTATVDLDEVVAGRAVLPVVVAR
jgi:hypothetical protein